MKFRHVTEPMRIMMFKIMKGCCRISLSFIFAGYKIAIFRVGYA